MTDNEIIKVLNERISSGKWIGKGFLDKQDFALLKNALDLINRQKAEIERLEYLLGYEEAKYDKCAKQFYKEAVKEFAERLKATNSTMDKRIVSVERIDNLVKEMVGDSE